MIRDIPGGPVVKILRFHCRGLGLHPWLGKFHMTRDVAEQKEKKRRDYKKGEDVLWGQGEGGTPGQGQEGDLARLPGCQCLDGTCRSLIQVRRPCTVRLQESHDSKAPGGALKDVPHHLVISRGNSNSALLCSHYV